MVQLVTFWLCRPKDPNSGPYEKCAVAMGKPRCSSWDPKAGDVETIGPLGIAGQWGKTPSQKRRWRAIGEDIQCWPLAFTHKCMSTHTYTLTWDNYKHIYTHSNF